MPKKTSEKSQAQISKGWLAYAKKVPSPNFNSRKSAVPRLIVIHNISLPPDKFGGGHIESFFQNQLDVSKHPYFETIKDLQVSAHLLIKRTGETVQFVSFDDRAWHAGNSSYLGVPACNDYSIGIELEGTDHKAFTNKQYQALAKAVRCIQQAYPLTRHHLAGHSDIAPGRKTDPGEKFDWLRLRASL